MDVPLFDKLSEAGLTSSPDEKRGGKSLAVFPHYRNNPGFYHIFEGEGEAVILKGVYGDNIRIIKRGITLTVDEFSILARFLFEVKKALLSYMKGESYTVQIIIVDGAASVVKIEEYQFTPKTEIDPLIPRPLTVSEYDSLESSVGDKTLFSRGFMGALFPEAASPYLQGLVSRFPDILAVYFLAFDLKLPSPSIISLAGRIYANISALSARYKEAGMNLELFGASYLPRQKELFKQARSKPRLLLAKKMTSQEIAQLLEEIAASVDKRGGYEIFNEDFFEPAFRITFMAIFLNFLFLEGFAYLKALTILDDYELLQAVFLSRKDSSFFMGGKTLEIPEYFDPAAPPVLISFPPPLQIEPPSLFTKLTPLKLFTHKKKILQTLATLHTALNGRDALLSAASLFHKTVRNTLLEHGRYMKTRKKIIDEKSVFSFESDDIRRLANDSYYSNIEPVLEYKENYIYRCSAQAAVYDIYKEDIKYMGLIAEKQTDNTADSAKLPCSSLGAVQELKGQAGANGAEIFCSRIPNLSSLSRLKAARAVVTDLAPLFSYVTEYCVINKIPLYYGVRFPELLYAKHLTLNKEDIAINATE
ncbi:MAG: hypothetical protein LBP51_06605 [Deferribacteraceae bacterium]|jgi:hypothetical protein|nr:hypothetical protein [Deferribacteraceae bacterium]